MEEQKRLLEILEELALLLELSGENPYKAQAYARAARTLAEHEVDLHRAVEEGTLRQLPGIGPSLEEAITEYVRTGTIALYERLRRQVPQGLLELTQLPLVGAKRARQLYEQLGISSVEQLEQVCREHRVATLKGFGPKMEQAFLEAIEQWKQFRKKLRLHEALQEARHWRKRIQTLSDVTQVHVTGTLRRYAEVVEEIVLLVVSPHPKRSIQQLQKLLPELQPEAEDRFVTRGKADVLVRVEIVPLEHAGWRLFRTTGTAEFVAALEAELSALGYEPQERALFRYGVPVSLQTEEELFALLNLPVIPPELRESGGLVEFVRHHGLPRIVTKADFCGMLHVHSTWSDGKASIRQMALAAKELGYRYIAICDHSSSARYAGGLTPERLAEQHREIDRLNATGLGIRILKGAEVDILPDGTLDYPEEVLEKLDVVVASVHSHFRQSRQEMTARILRALEHPAVHILGHATGRLLLSRPPYEVDLEPILEAAVRLGKIVELNAQPYRLDVSWEHLARWRTRGLRIAVNPDAHSVAELAYTELGIIFARKALFPPEQVVNTLPLQDFLQLCQRIQGRNT
ncbi:MAG: DNA polymerase/3'-5' exonuclease PolX [Candidatus Kapabacteria bacterium]|nr:DNA polymerase/3'-5' exonuclease PolX [Candidatus Kapabacteria bacterium]MDW8011617.1 DNA polymerase/3'-5' exonuclease PolX [Bacteroidota bacterium]